MENASTSSISASFNGYLISENRLQMDPVKVQAVADGQLASPNIQRHRDQSVIESFCSANMKSMLFWLEQNAIGTNTTRF